MDRAWSSGSQHSAAVRAAGSEPVELVRAGGRGDGPEPAVHAFDRRAVSASSGVRLAANDGLPAEAGPWGESQAGPAFDADNGPGSDLRQAAALAAGTGVANLPVFAAERGDCSSEPGVEHGHHVRAAGVWVRVPDGGTGLVQPIRALLGVV